MLRFFGLAALATGVACTAGAPPQLTGLTDQVAQVGTELDLELDGTSSNGAHLQYSYHAADLTDLDGHAQITVSPSGAGEFRWTPLAADVGSHAFDFTASNGSAKTTVTININVKSAIGASTAPVFRQPLGTGTTIDLTKTMCADLDVVIEDKDTPMVAIKQEQPLIDGAKLTTTGGQTAKWHWCPSMQQQSTTRYTLVLSADDKDNPKTLKNYLVVLRGGTSSTTGCPGSGPAISSTPSDQTTRLDLAVTATVTDAIGIKDAPLLYYSMTDPGAMPDVSQMTQLSTTLASGDGKNGTYTGTIPNPIASQADGTSQTIYYVLAADDHDATDNCDHTTTSQVYQMTVTAGGGSTAGLCQPCTDDAQCGTGNECVYMGSMGDSYCLQGCGSGCPEGYSCSNAVVYSVDYASAQQCIPQSGSCVAPAGTCEDDIWTPNETLAEASLNGDLPAGYYNLVSCPDPNSTTRAEDDWYEIDLTETDTIDAYLSGDGSIDLDLALYAADGTYIDSSTGLTDQEELHDCQPAGTYYLKVSGYGYARDAYSLNFTLTSAASCP